MTSVAEEDSRSLSLSSGGSEDPEDGLIEREDDDFHNILLLGDSGVGKSDLIGRLGKEEQCNTTFHATIGMTMEARTLEVDGKMRRLHIWDPSGSERFKNLIISSKPFQNAKAIVFVFDLNYRKSFLSIQKWIDQTQSMIHPESLSCILIGNKCDIPVNESRRVSLEEAEAFAKSRGIKFLETSTITGKNVYGAFLYLCQEMKQKKQSEANVTQ